jgi:DNA-binding transcriptional ArsR family regulator
MARSLEIGTVLVPPAPGVLSALGLLEADVEHHLVRTFLRPLHGLQPGELAGAVAGLEREAQQMLRGEGYRAPVEVERSVDLKYQGQSFELTIPLPPSWVGDTAEAKIAEAFGKEHERTYGHQAEGDPIQLVNLRLTARVARREAAVVPRLARVAPVTRVRPCTEGVIPCIRINGYMVAILEHMSALSDTTRCRMLLMLEKHELTVSDLCSVLQMPQSSVSRHLKTLGDDGWVASRRDATSRFYTMPLDDLDSAASRLWPLIREQVASTTAAAHDERRLTACSIAAASNRRNSSPPRRGSGTAFARISSETRSTFGRCLA